MRPPNPGDGAAGDGAAGAGVLRGATSRSTAGFSVVSSLATVGSPNVNDGKTSRHASRARATRRRTGRPEVGGIARSQRKSKTSRPKPMVSRASPPSTRKLPQRLITHHTTLVQSARQERKEIFWIFPMCRGQA